GPFCGGGGGGGGGGGPGSLQVRPSDPNDITGPAEFVLPTQTLDYTIRFENKASATAPAQVVVITNRLDADLDWTTFELGAFGFGGQVFEIPAGRRSFSTRIDARQTVGLIVDLTADLKLTTGVVTWTFTSLDPETLDLTGDVLAGFLPPNVASPQGEGFVSYAVRARGASPTGTRIDSLATIVFDTEDPMDTPAIFNIIDA